MKLSVLFALLFGSTNLHAIDFTQMKDRISMHIEQTKEEQTRFPESHMQWIFQSGVQDGLTDSLLIVKNINLASLLKNP